MEELTKTPEEQALYGFVRRDGRSFEFLSEPFLFENKVIASKGKILCWTHPEQCNGKYETPEKIPSSFPAIANDIATKRVDKVLDFSVLKSFLTSLDNVEDLRPTKTDCITCGDSGSCTDCECGSSHECGKCSGQGYSETEPKALLGIGTGKFFLYQIDQLYSAACKLNATSMIYIGSNETDSLQHFRCGECWLIVMSTSLLADQQLLEVPLT